MFSFLRNSRDSQGDSHGKGNTSLTTADEPGTAVPNSTTENDGAVETGEANTGNRDNIIRINFGTNMAIDTIYAYIERDWEEIGRTDAGRDPDATYMNSKLEIIKQGLKRRFELVRLRYNKDMRYYEAQMDNLKALGLTTGMKQMEAHIDTCREHLTKIEELEDKFRRNDPSIATMEESYRRGFVMGVNMRINEIVR